jgi:hypothetical protein
MIAGLLVAAPLAAVRADGKAAPSAPAKAAQSSAAASGKPLDLKAPAISRVFTPGELAALMARPDEPDQDVETTVAVEGDMHDRINVPSGIMSLPWALRHPAQAWRIFVPAPAR